MAYQQVSLDQVTVAATGFKGPEGVTVDREGNMYGGGTDGVIRKLSPDGKVTEFARTGGRPAGMALDRQGNLFVCDVGKAAVLKVTPSGAVSVFADQVGSVKLFLPNFPVFDAEGNLYVSNSTDHVLSGMEEVMAEIRNPVPKGSLVRLRPDGRGEVAATGLYLANGTAIDPKEDAVYVLESTRNDCLRIQIKKDGTFGKPEVYSKDFPALPDGMAFDVDRNLYVTLPAVVTGGNIAPANQILKVDTNGNWSVLIDDSAGTKLVFPTNCAFGGPGLQ